MILGMRAQFVILVLVSILVLGILVSAQTVYAATIDSNGSGGGSWKLGSTWSGGVVPSASDDITIKSGDTVTVDDFIRIVTGSITIESGATLIVDGTKTRTFFLDGGTLTNSGTLTIRGGFNVFHGDLRLTNSATLTNIGTINIDGGSDFLTGRLTLQQNTFLTNIGTITIDGGRGATSGSLGSDGTLVNIGIITINGGTSGRSGLLLINFGGSLTNEGTIILNGRSFGSSGKFDNFSSSFLNDCGGVIIINGGRGTFTGAFTNFSSGIVTNSGTMTFNGGSGVFSGSFTNFGSATNHNTIIFNPGTGRDSGTLVGNPIIEDPIPCILNDLVNQINDLIDSGDLNDGQATSMIEKLKTAISIFDNGQENAACNLLNAFIKEINALVLAGTLSVSQGDDLIAEVQQIQTSIGC